MDLTLRHGKTQQRSCPLHRYQYAKGPVFPTTFHLSCSHHLSNQLKSKLLRDILKIRPKILTKIFCMEGVTAKIRDIPTMFVLSQYVCKITTARVLDMQSTGKKNTLI